MADVHRRVGVNDAHRCSPGSRVLPPRAFGTTCGGTTDLNTQCVPRAIDLVRIRGRRYQHEIVQAYASSTIYDFA